MEKKKLGPVILLVTLMYLCSSSVVWVFLKKNGNVVNYEKRELAELPKFTISNYKTYPEQFEEYLNDNMPFRDELVDINTYFDYFLFDSTTNEDVIVGKDNWLFYAREEDGDPVGCYQGTNLFSEEELRTICKNCIDQKEFLEKEGKEFVIFIAPDKERVYYDKMPEKYGYPAENYRVLQVVNYLRDYTDIRVVYPYEELMQAKESVDENLWYKTDTHWNWTGAYVGATALLEELGIEMPDLDSDKIKIFEKECIENNWVKSFRLENGYLDRDLADMIHLGNILRTGDNEYWVEGYNLHDMRIVEWDLKNKLIFHSDDADERRLYVVRDSFASHMSLCIASQFNDCCMRYRGTYKPEELTEWNPDIVVYETVERYVEELKNFTLYER